MEGFTIVGPRPRADSYRIQHSRAATETRADTSAQPSCPACYRIGYDTQAAYCVFCGYSGYQPNNSNPVVAQRSSRPLRHIGQRCGHCGGVWPNCCIYGYDADQRSRRR